MSEGTPTFRQTGLNTPFLRRAVSALEVTLDEADHLRRLSDTTPEAFCEERKEATISCSSSLLSTRKHVGEWML